MDASKVKCFGPGLDTKGITAGAPATFTVDTSEAGEAPLEVTYTDQTGEKSPPVSCLFVCFSFVSSSFSLFQTAKPLAIETDFFQ